VFLKSHSPLTLPGMRSTAGHVDQSSMWRILLEGDARLQSRRRGRA
jgi:hypothetical protein